MLNGTSRSGVRLETLEALHRGVIESPFVGVIKQSGAGDGLELNAAAQRMLGITAGNPWPPHEVDPSWMVIHEDGTPFPTEERPLGVTLRTGEAVQDVVMGIRRPDGTCTWLQVNSVPTGEAGEARGAVAVFIDVTERKRTESRMAEQAALLDIAHDAIFLRDLEGRISYWNRGAETTYGFTAAEAVGRVAHELLGTVFPEPLPAIEAAVASVGSWEGELRQQTRAGVQIVTASRWAAHRAPGGQLLAAMEVNRDITAQKAAHEAIRKSDARFRALLDSAPDAAVIVDTAGHVVLVNEQTERLFGYGRDDLVGLPIEVLLPERFRGGHLAHRRDYAADPRTRPMGAGLDLAGLRQDGTEFPVDISLSAIETDEGRLVMAFIRDITDRKRAEAELKESEDRLTRFLDAMPVAVWVATPDGQPFYANSGAQRLLGRGVVPGAQLEELTEVYQSYLAGIDVRYPTERLWINDVLQGRPSHCDDMEIHRPDGVVALEVWGAPVPATDGSVSYALAAFADITERKSAEELMARQSALLDLSYDPIFMWDDDHRITYWNQACERVYGFSRQEALGADPSDLLHTRSSQDLELIRAECLRSGHWEGELSQRRSDGRWIEVEGKWAAYRSEDGHLLGTMEIAREITARKAAEAELRARAEDLNRLNLDLERSNEELEQFAYVASHDLAEPLRAISVPISFLARRYQGKLDAEADQFIDFAVDGCQRMQDMINDLLAFSRAGRSGPAAGRCDLNQVVDKVLAGLGPRVADTGADIRVGQLPTLIGDGVALGQVLQNLLTNALKFVPPDRPPEVEVSAHRAPSAWQFDVTDNGIGIDPRHRERIFGMFKRLHTRDQYPGTGIGLAMCKKIVEHLGGRIGVEDGPGGQGSRFWFTIPDMGVTP